jgi:glycerol-3-phosphate acyltransferase PlsY
MTIAPPAVDAATRGPRARWLAFLAHLLFVLAAWSVFIKYLFPMVFAMAGGEPVSRYIQWDFWPLVHVWLGWALLARPRYTWWLALLVSIAEILIVVILLGGFLADPDWNMWRSNWFVNKVFVLGAFVLLLGTLIRNPQALRATR